MIRNDGVNAGDLLIGLPPPPPLPDFLLTNNPTHSSKPVNDFKEDEIKSFEKVMKRVIDAERLFNVKPFHANNTRLESQLQEGPKCGLVALSIATSKTDHFKTPDELFAEAVKRGYTTQGEMYSCQNMASLVESQTEFKSLVIDGGINSHIDCILHCLQNGGLMLVPYDADCNHSPCCKGGHSAHWAVMSGIVIFKSHDHEEEVHSPMEDNALSVDSELFPACQCVRTRGDGFFTERDGGQRVKVVRDEDGAYVTRGEGAVGGKAEIYLAGKQGKSRHLALWPFDKLAESNSNLVELSEQQKLRNFALPNGGVAEGLKGKAVLINSV